MAAPYDIFIGLPVDPERVALETGAILALAVRRIDDDGDVFWETYTSAVRVTVGSHDFLEDYGLDFPRYPVDVQIRGSGAEAVARQIFAALRQSGRYPLMLVFDLQRKLDEYTPGSRAAAEPRTS